MADVNDFLFEVKAEVSKKTLPICRFVGETEFAPSGDGLEPVFEMKVNKSSGLTEYIQTGVVNAYEQIQIATEGSSLKDLILRYERGDLTALGDPSTSYYGDFSNAPKNLFEAVDIINNAKSAFYQLPVEVRDKFNNDVNVYLKEVVSLDEDTFLSKYFEKKEVVDDGGVVNE